MYRAMLHVQWIWGRMELGVYSAVGFAFPMLALKAMGFSGSEESISSMLRASTAVGACLGVLAFLAGTTLASRPWILDHARHHVLALSLPIAWPRFVQLRFLAGATLLAVPAIGVWLGGLVAALVIDVPATLHVYPASIALRFLGAGLVFYAIAFAMQYLGGRRAPMIVAGALAAWLLLETAGQAFGFGSISIGAWNLLSKWPGPLEMITARWMLVDV
jgi:hypothetical protein